MKRYRLPVNTRFGKPAPPVSYASCSAWVLILLNGAVLQVSSQRTFLRLLHRERLDPPPSPEKGGKEGVLTMCPSFAAAQSALQNLLLELEGATLIRIALIRYRFACPCPDHRSVTNI